MDNLSGILSANNIDIDLLSAAVHADMIGAILQCIWTRAEREADYALYIRRCYHTMPDHAAAHMIVASVTNLVLPDSDIARINACLLASMRKRGRRVSIARTTRARLLVQQGGKCAICGAPITLADMHVDHIIPWVYVGDELADNLQGLCPDCNRRKGNRMATNVSALLLRRQKKEEKNEKLC